MCHSLLDRHLRLHPHLLSCVVQSNLLDYGLASLLNGCWQLLQMKWNSLKWENRPLKQKWPVVTVANHTSVQTTMTSRPPIKRQQNRSHNNVTIACPVARVINAIITWAEEADGADAYFYSLWANTNYSNVIWAVVIVVVLHVVTLPFSVSPPVVEVPSKHRRA